MRTTSILLGAWLVFAALPALAADKIETGFVGAPTASGWPWYIAMAKGYFAAAGIELDPVYVPSAPGITQQVSAGSLDIVAGTGFTDPLYAIEKFDELIALLFAFVPYVIIRELVVRVWHDRASANRIR